MENQHSVAAHWSGGFDEPGLQRWAENLRRQLGDSRASLGLVFISPRFFPHATELLELLRVHAQIPLLAGCSSGGLIAGREEIEDKPGLALALYSLPGAQLKAIHFTQSDVEAATGPNHWPTLTGIAPSQTNGWLVFADPFHLDSEGWLKSWNEAYGPLPVLGGLASGTPAVPVTQVYLDGDVFEEGGVAISIGGDVALGGVISQGCTPIGETWTLTRVERNMIHEIGNRPAYEVLAETFNALSAEEQKKSRGNLFIGLVINEYLDEFHRGDFLVRNLIAADPRSGTIAVGAMPRPGQTVQFQRHDATAATEDMTALLRLAREQLAGTPIYGGCLCACNGRGQGLFGKPGHDAGMVQDYFGPLAVAGFFCNGEIGPIGRNNFIHGYTVSLALFVKKNQAPATS